MDKCPHCNSRSVELRDSFVESDCGVIQVSAVCTNCGSDIQCEFHYSTSDTSHERNEDKEKG